MLLDYKLQNISLPLNLLEKASNTKKWQVPRRVLCITNLQANQSTGLLERFLNDLWGENSSAILVQIEQKDGIGKNRFLRQGSQGNIQQFLIERYLGQKNSAQGDLKLQVSEIATIFKPELILVLGNSSITTGAVQAAIELGIPVIYEDVENLSALEYLVTSERFKNKIAKFRRAESSSIIEMTIAAKGLIKSDSNAENRREDKKILRIAAVMDEFTFHSFSPECELLQISPSDVINELTEFNPDLLFIESAWNGKNNLWDRKIGNPSIELRAAIDWCRERYIPTVFWNKEDPVHFETFLTTASLFDHVFTTDIDCISQYKASLGHERVYLLPFACQPKTHNPIESYERKDAFAFAGAYYLRYPDRIKDLESYVEELPKFRSLEIFDRNFGKDDVNYQFPERYQPFIVGTLPFNEIDKAYKGYKYAINLNSIKQSQSMFARRLFDLLACNTISISNFSRGVRLMFGDLVISTDQGKEALRRLEKISSNSLDVAKLRLAGLRKVLLEHTYAHRLNYIVNKALGKEADKDILPPVLVLGMAENEAEFNSLVNSFELQKYEKKRMLLVLGKSMPRDRYPATLHNGKLKIISRDDGSQIRVKSQSFSGEWISVFCSKDYYGPNYLTDLLLATKYVESKAIGKGAYFELLSKPTLLNDELSYKFSKQAFYRNSIILASQISNQTLASFLEKAEVAIFEGVAFNVDFFNYCMGGSSQKHYKNIADKVNDIDLNVGISISELNSTAEKIAPLKSELGENSFVSAELLSKQFGVYSSKSISSKLELGLWQITSDLAPGKHEYIYAQHLVPAGQFPSNEVKLFLETTPGLNLQFVMRFLDSDRKNIGHEIRNPNRNQIIVMPPECAFLELGLRLYESGRAEIKGLMWGHRKLEPAALLGSDHLVLTNQYPAYHDLYRNAFIHTRLKAYESRGLNFDVFCLKENQAIDYREFEDINVLSGGEEALRKLLDSGRYKTICVHFLSPKMWDVLKDYIDDIQVRVWLHGSEVHPWHRRKYNYINEDQIERAKKESEARMQFWQSVVNPMHKNLRLVFVSQTFSQEVMEDLEIKLDNSQYSVIHNPIDTSIFSYSQKSIEQRKKILSIRPFASRQYANDLSVKAILELSKLKNFDELEFRIIGDGVLFDETVEPLRKFRNVILEKKFVTQSEIAQLHKEYGIFLCPTRWDSHGVSRDEAMSAGLVPITTKIAAIPEFVDIGVAMLSDPEDWTGLADGISTLIKNPQLFSEMSEAASRRIRQTRDIQKIIDLELKQLGL